MNFRMLRTLLVSAVLAASFGCSTSSQDQKPEPMPTQKQPDSPKNQADAPAQTPALEGTWEGALEISGTSLPILFHLNRSQDAPGEWTATMDSPSQGAKGIPVSKVNVEDGNELQLKVGVIDGTYKGTLKVDTIEGSWSQGGKTFPLALTRTSAEQASRPARPQTPQAPFPYTIEEVQFAGGPPTAGSDEVVKLSGTLTLPKTDGPHPAIVLLSGSGPQDRDETLMGHKPFWVLADFLSRHGVAVLRFDDRGVAESSGQFKNATITNFVTDAVAAVDYLDARDDINPKAIGLLGHSEGANVAPRASLASTKVGFVVMLAPTTVPGTELLARQNALILEGHGMSTAGAKSYEKTMLKTLDKIVKKPLGKPLSREFQAELVADFKAAAEAMSPEDRKYYGPTDPATVDKVLNAMVQQLSTGWMRSFLAMKPTNTFTKLNVPALALFGSKDVQIPAAQNAPRLRKEFAKKPDATLTVLDGLNHLFQPASTGLPAEYATIETTVSPEALNTILEWLAGHEWAEAAQNN